MQFLTAKSVLYIRLLGLLCIIFFSLKSPSTITTAHISLILGQAMNLPIVQISDSNPLFGILAMFISLLIISDLIPILADNISYFETLVPTRLLMFFLLGSYCLVSENALIANNLVFTYAFLEIWVNFLVYNNLRDEKYYRAKDYLEKHGEELRDMANSRVVPVNENEEQ